MQIPIILLPRGRRTCPGIDHPQGKARGLCSVLEHSTQDQKNQQQTFDSSFCRLRILQNGDVDFFCFYLLGMTVKLVPFPKQKFWLPVFHCDSNLNKNQQKTELESTPGPPCGQVGNDSLAVTFSVRTLGKSIREKVAGLKAPVTLCCRRWLPFGRDWKDSSCAFAVAYCLI